LKNKIKILLTDIEDIEKQSFARFSYRERMKLERTLHLLLLECTELDIIGFSKVSKRKVIDELQVKHKSKEVIILVTKIYNFRNLIKAISSGNPYEKYDALYQADSDRISIFANLKMRIRKIEEILSLIKTNT